MIPEFTLPSSEGTATRVSDFRGRRNLVLAFADEPEREGWLELASALARREADLRREEAEVLIVLRASVAAAASVKARENLPFRLLADADGRIHALFGVGAGAMAPPVVYLTDRFGEVFSVQPAAQALPLPAAREILDWLAFVNSQCPECGAPNWPG
jgi:peroxiredoxin